MVSLLTLTTKDQLLPPSLNSLSFSLSLSSSLSLALCGFFQNFPTNDLNVSRFGISTLVHRDSCKFRLKVERGGKKRKEMATLLELLLFFFSGNHYLLFGLFLQRPGMSWVSLDPQDFYC